MASSNPIIYSYVEIFPFIFCLVEKMDTAPLPRYIIYPVCPWKSSCVSYEVSTHHSTNDMSPTLKLIFIPCVPLRYFNKCLSSSKFYSSGFFTRVVRISTAFYMYKHAWVLMNSIFVMMWWKLFAYSYARYFASILSHTLNK